MPVAGITSSITSLIGDHGLYAVFVLLIVAAVFPAASELVMLYAGAVAAGAFAGAHVVLFGNTLHSHAAAYVAMSVAGTLGNLVGAAIGWAIGDYGGRPMLETHGRKLHVSHAKLDRMERWFDRYGALVVLFGLAAPVVRSFVAIPAGIARVPFGRFVALAAVGCAAFCFAFAGIGWAVGSNYGSVRKYVDYVVLAAIVLGIAYLLGRRVASSRLARHGRDPAG
jgi:membrane protein DedA with SNARE-associated domain